MAQGSGFSLRKFRVYCPEKKCWYSYDLDARRIEIVPLPCPLLNPLPKPPVEEPSQPTTSSLATKPMDIPEGTYPDFSPRAGVKVMPQATNELLYFFIESAYTKLNPRTQYFFDTNFPRQY